MKSHSRVVNLGVNTALSLGSTVLSHPDETTVSPAGSPRVTDNPVGGGGTGVVSDSDDGMVARGAAGAGHDTGFVGLESSAGSVDSDSNGLSINGAHHGVVVSSNGFVSGGVNLALGSGVLAGTVSSGVRVVRVQLSTGSLEVLEGFVGPATITSIAVLVAINLLLRRKLQESSALDAVSGLDNFSGSERPARTALALILDSSGARTCPVLGGTENFSSDLVLSSVVIRLRLLAGTEHFLVFGFSRVGEEVVTSGVSGLGVGVVLDDVGVNLEVTFETDSVLFGGLVVLSVVSNELHELKVLLVRSLESGSGNGGDGSDSEGGLHLVFIINNFCIQI